MKVKTIVIGMLLLLTETFQVEESALSCLQLHFLDGYGPNSVDTIGQQNSGSSGFLGIFPSPRGSTTPPLGAPTPKAIGNFPRGDRFINWHLSFAITLLAALSTHSVANLRRGTGQTAHFVFILQLTQWGPYSDGNLWALLQHKIYTSIPATRNQQNMSVMGIQYCEILMDA